MRYEFSRKPRRCPVCNEKTVASILYGEPAFSPKLAADLEEKRIVLGGCIVTDDDPKWQCTACDAPFFKKLNFGLPNIET